MGTEINFSKCEKILEKVFYGKKLHEAIVLIEDESGDISWNKGYNRTVDSPMNLASITKLFVTTVILQQIEKGKLTLDDKISLYLDKRIIEGLHVFKGKDYSDELTIKILLFQVSGLPDYFFEKTSDGVSFETLMWEKNQYVPFDKMVETAKKMKPRFAPEKGGRAIYADINFDLLGKILENILEKELSDIFDEEIFQPLALKNTYIISNKNHYAPKAYRNGKAYEISKFLRCCPASGGGVTTAREFMVFLKAFWTGKLFDKSLLEPLKPSNPLQMLYGCIRYAGGHMYINANFPFKEKHEIRGHSGATGSFGYFCEETGLFFVGDLNDSRMYVPANMLLKMEYETGQEVKKMRSGK